MVEWEEGEQEGESLVDLLLTRYFRYDQGRLANSIRTTSTTPSSHPSKSLPSHCLSLKPLPLHLLSLRSRSERLAGGSVELEAVKEGLCYLSVASSGSSALTQAEEPGNLISRRTSSW
jgi:hypothetical protein